MHGGGPDGLSDALCGRVLERLGLRTAPGVDLQGLGAVYAAWCEGVPFDNVLKMIALRAGDGAALPRIDPAGFFEAWLEHGTGGTCWPTSNALYALVRTLGFDARRVAGSMRDLGTVTHGSVKVRLDGRDWLVDSSLMTREPLPLGDGVFVSADPVFHAEVERDGAEHVVWVEPPPRGEPLPCRLLVDPATTEEYEARYEATRAGGPFNQRLFARVNRPGEVLVFFGSTRFSKTAAGTDSQALGPEELKAALVVELGLSRAAVERWEACGGLAASFEPPSGPRPPAPARQPPSRRAG